MVKETEPHGIIFDIKRYAIHDGPGIRTTVFMKGCPLRCAWCHNPESWLLRPEIMHRQNRCIGCRRCVEACQYEAVIVDGLIVDGPIDGFDSTDNLNVTDNGIHSDQLSNKPSSGIGLPIRTLAQRCNGAGRCADACPTGARELAGREMSVEQLMGEILRDEPFFDQSGGGVTFSGGEPLFQYDFLVETLQACRDRGLHTALDTTLYAPWQQIQRLLPLIDLLLCDLKHFDSDTHERYTGVPNERILANLQGLARARADVIIRVPLIPSVNDDRSHLTQVAQFLATLGNVQRIDLLPFNEAIGSKLDRISLPDGQCPDNVREMIDLEPQSDEHINELVELVRAESGLKVTVGG